MAVATRISPAVAERALEAFCVEFPEILDQLVEVRIVANPEMTIDVGVPAGVKVDLPEHLPRHESCRIRVYESDAHVELLSGFAA